MLVLRGATALSPFRLARIRAAVSRGIPGLTVLGVEHVYAVDLEREPSESEASRLRELLAGRPDDGDDGPQLVVAPRPGTVSPWSSKATDILHWCGLGGVRRVERAARWTLGGDALPTQRRAAAPLLHDRMTEAVFDSAADLHVLFRAGAPSPAGAVPLDALAAADQRFGLALSPTEMRFLREAYTALGRDPTDVELMMFAQVNSEHCRHKIFNSAFVLDGAPQELTPFQMIRHTHAATRGLLPPGTPGEVLSAYRDNAAVVRGWPARRLLADPRSGRYVFADERPLHVAIKVETHNHPTAISPHPGAGTGVGGEIRDEAAVGRGGKTKAGMAGFATSHLRIPGQIQPWETDDPGRPDRIASALRIMLEAPIGAASYANEFGRANLAGFFRTFEARADGAVRGYHKPLMIAGGYGNVAPDHVAKGSLPPGAPLVVLGGPAMRIGLGGGAASSLAQGSSDADLDFASVQRANPEMQRRCQEVLDRCQALGAENPILAIHDVGAGGLSNALPELVHGGEAGGRFDLRAVPTAEPDMNPLELWCNEAQERYVLAIAPDQLDAFSALCERERCPFAVVGQATAGRHLRVDDARFGSAPIDLPLDVLFGSVPRDERRASHVPSPGRPLDRGGVTLADALDRVLRFPAVADKTFLVTIADRSISGQIARDPMVGPWQVPVADVAVTTTDYLHDTGEAMAIGERMPVALLDPAASARLAVGEAITNLAAARIDDLRRVALSANWMAAAGQPGEDAALYDAVRAVGLELCPALGIPIPVGKDSLSMRTVWSENGATRSVVSPLSLVVTAFAPCSDVTATSTPLLVLDEPTVLVLVDLGAGRNRLGGSTLAQVYGQLGDVPPDLDDPKRLSGLFQALQELRASGLLLAWHDRSDGGLAATLLEMAFCSRCGLDVDIPGDDPLAALFAEELGGVLQVRTTELEAARDTFARHGVLGLVHAVGSPTAGDRIRFLHRARPVLVASRTELHRTWSSLTHAMQQLRDDPACADEEHDRLIDATDPGLVPLLTFDVGAQPGHVKGRRPSVAILREQGVNGQVEMAAAFERAGFEAYDVHVTDLAEGRTDLSTHHGVVACGGFSYGDVLGAGVGWAATTRWQPRVRDAFAAFFARTDTFALGVCNGCQMFARLGDEILPGTASWPAFLTNRSEVFEGRLSLVHIERSPSILFAGMEGSRLLVPVAHGEGRATFRSDQDHAAFERAGLVAARYGDGRGRIASTYPANPNGSTGAISAVTTADGRVTALMPHPERVFRWATLSWHPDSWRHPSGDSPWMRLFRNARAWLA